MFIAKKSKKVFLELVNLLIKYYNLGYIVVLSMPASVVFEITEALS